jgi:hypothetical protein
MNIFGFCICGRKTKEGEDLCDECQLSFDEPAREYLSEDSRVVLRLRRSNEYLNTACSLCLQWIQRNTLVCVGSFAMSDGHTQDLFCCQECMQNTSRIDEILERTARNLEASAMDKRWLKGRIVIPPYAWCKERLGYSLEEGLADDLT